MPSKTWQFLMVWPFLMSSYSSKSEFPDFGVLSRSATGLREGANGAATRSVQAGLVGDGEKGALFLHEEFLLL
jgi:hypothetical protein